MVVPAVGQVVRGNRGGGGTSPSVEVLHERQCAYGSACGTLAEGGPVAVFAATAIASQTHMVKGVGIKIGDCIRS